MVPVYPRISSIGREVMSHEGLALRQNYETHPSSDHPTVERYIHDVNRTIIIEAP
jgi:hypothetical protein